MGEWTIDPTGRTATLIVEGNNAKVSVSENNGSSITYTVKFRQGDYCGEYTFTQEGTTPTPVSNSYINVKLTNKLDKDVYVTGYERISVMTPDQSDWAPIMLKLKNPVDGCACVKVPAKGSTTIPYSDLNVTVDSNNPDETISKYDGGQILKDAATGEPVYWRVYSWTSAEDPAVIKLDKSADALPTVFHTGTTTNPETLEFIIIETDEYNEGTIKGCSTPCYQ